MKHNFPNLTLLRSPAAADASREISPLAPQTILGSPAAAIRQQGASGAELFFSYPDTLRYRAELMSTAAGAEAHAFPNPVAIRSVRPEAAGSPAANPPIADAEVIAAGDEWYLRARIHLMRGGSVQCWVRVEARTALVFLDDARRNRSDAAHMFFGSLANLLRAEPGKAVSCSEQLLLRGSFNSVPTVESVIAVPGIVDPSNSLRSLRTAMEAPSPHELDPARLRDDAGDGHNWDPVALSAQALAAEESGSLPEAAGLFHRCYLLGFPFALENEHRIRSRMASPFRDLYPQIFDEIRRGNRLHALTMLRAVSPQFGSSGSSILAYALRGSGNPDEGLKACTDALAASPDQNDVLAHRWSFYFEKGDIGGMLRSAADHIERYPFEPLAAKNLVHSLLLAGRVTDAIAWVHRYAAFTESLGLAIKELFEVYEAASDWQTLGEYYDDIKPLLSHAPAEAYVWIGECLIEQGRFEEAEALLFDTLSREPQNARVVLAISRLLARDGRESEALGIIESALRDPTRQDRADLHALLVTFGAEIMRRTGRPADAVILITRELPPDLVAHAAAVGTAPALELAESLFELGRYKESRSLLDRLVTVAPDDPLVLELRRIVEKAAH